MAAAALSFGAAYAQEPEQAPANDAANTEVVAEVAEAEVAEPETVEVAEPETVETENVEVEVAEPVAAEAETVVEEPVEKQGRSAGKIVLVVLGSLVAAAALLLGVYVGLSRIKPDIFDSILYTPEELEILHYKK